MHVQLRRHCLACAESVLCLFWSLPEYLIATSRLLPPFHFIQGRTCGISIDSIDQAAGLHNKPACAASVNMQCCEIWRQSKALCNCCSCMRRCAMQPRACPCARTCLRELAAIARLVEIWRSRDGYSMPCVGDSALITLSTASAGNCKWPAEAVDGVIVASSRLDVLPAGRRILTTLPCLF